MEVEFYDKNYNPRAVPVFRCAPRKIVEGGNQEAELDLVRASIEGLERSLKPAATNQIKESLGRLVLHKGVGSYTEGQASVLINDYIRFLSDCPHDLLAKACDECILDPDMQYFPQVGRIRAKFTQEITMRQLYLGRLRKILELSECKERRADTPNPQAISAGLARRFKCQ